MKKSNSNLLVTSNLQIAKHAVHILSKKE